MQEWIDKELETACFGTVHSQTKARKPKTRKSRSRKSKGNVKLQKRFQKVLNTMSQKPSLKFPAGCEGHAETKAAYRFLDNEHVTFATILGPHQRCDPRTHPRATGGSHPPGHHRTGPHAPQRGHGRSRPLQRHHPGRLLQPRFPGHDSGTLGPGGGGRRSLARDPLGLREGSRRRNGPSGVPSRSRTRKAFAGWRDTVRPARWRAQPRRRSSFRSPIAKAMFTSIFWKRKPSRHSSQGLVHHSRRPESCLGCLRTGLVRGPRSRIFASASPAHRSSPNGLWRFAAAMPRRRRIASASKCAKLARPWSTSARRG